MRIWNRRGKSARRCYQYIRRLREWLQMSCNMRGRNFGVSHLHSTVWRVMYIMALYVLNCFSVPGFRSFLAEDRIWIGHNAVDNLLYRSIWSACKTLNCRDPWKIAWTPNTRIFRSSSLIRCAT
jgi:hypothetical protein